MHSRKTEGVLDSLFLFWYTFAMNTPTTDPEMLGDAQLLNEVFQIQLNHATNGDYNEAKILEEMRLRYIDVCKKLRGMPSND